MSDCRRRPRVPLASLDTSMSTFVCLASTGVSLTVNVSMRRPMLETSHVIDWSGCPSALMWMRMPHWRSYLSS